MDEFFLVYARVPERSNGTVCKTVGESLRRFESFPVYRGKQMIEIEFMVDKRSSPSVETNKTASALCKRLFPTWACPPTQGELQRIIIDSLQFSSSELAIKNAGEWWLWIRDLFIENAISKTEKNLIMRMAAESAAFNRPIHFVTTRSPELLHAQVEGQGDKTLPRSRKAILTLAEIVLQSKRFLPTQSTIIFADLAIDNLERITERCDLSSTQFLGL